MLIYFHNMSGMSSASQLSAVRAGIQDCRYDVIVLVETWFDSGISSSVLPATVGVAVAYLWLFVCHIQLPNWMSAMVRQWSRFGFGSNYTIELF